MRGSKATRKLVGSSSHLKPLPRPLGAHISSSVKLVVASCHSTPPRVTLQHPHSRSRCPGARSWWAGGEPPACPMPISTRLCRWRLELPCVMVGALTPDDNPLCAVSERDMRPPPSFLQMHWRACRCAICTPWSLRTAPPAVNSGGRPRHDYALLLRGWYCVCRPRCKRGHHATRPV